MFSSGSNGAVLRVSALSAGYGGRAVVSGVDFEAHGGEIVCLLGSNGCGKSTVLRTLTGMLPCISGDIAVEGRLFEDYSAKELSRCMSVVLTERMPVQMMTAFEIVLMGRLPYISYFGRASVRDREAAAKALCDVGAEKLATRDFGSLSDGEKQKVMIARALAQEPRLIVLDEPTSHLDIRHKLEVMQILRRLADEKRVAIVLALHDIDIALNLADILIMLKDGAVTAKGDVRTVLAERRIEDLYGIENISYSEFLGSLAEMLNKCNSAGGDSGSPRLLR